MLFSMVHISCKIKLCIHDMPSFHKLLTITLIVGHLNLQHYSVKSVICI